jgi:hypothetical protein
MKELTISALFEEKKKKKKKRKKEGQSDLRIKFKLNCELCDVKRELRHKVYSLGALRARTERPCLCSMVLSTLVNILVCECC